jgi:hypothetical protein
MCGAGASVNGRDGVSVLSNYWLQATQCTWILKYVSVVPSREPHRYANADVADKAYTLPVALTIAAQRSLLPVTPIMLAANPCLKSLKVVSDLTTMEEMKTRAGAWQCVVACP